LEIDTSVSTDVKDDIVLLAGLETGGFGLNSVLAVPQTRRRVLAGLVADGAANSGSGRVRNGNRDIRN